MLEFFHPVTYVALGILVLWNLVTFALFAIDKARAKAGEWRIKEATLFITAFLMGGFGSIAGMYALRHKTQKISFKILIPLAVVVNVVVLIGLGILLF
ncbi:MAG: DUF1294 domain-containing protein [Defluviitaleaceae bacterium]|nr:DUF1294 domain-containing protein [Defluviitaleaceae bacterium]